MSEDVKTAAELAEDKLKENEAADNMEPKEETVEEQNKEKESLEETAPPKKKKRLMLIAPLNKRITVRIEGPVEKVTDGGLIIPITVDEKIAPTRGTVLGVALDCSQWVKDMLKTGMEVVFSKYSGVDIHTVEHGGGKKTQYQILKEEDILAVMITEDELNEYVYIDTKDVTDGQEESK